MPKLAPLRFWRHIFAFLQWLRIQLGVGTVVSVLAFYSKDPSSNPAKVDIFLLNVVWKEQKQTQRGRVNPILKKTMKFENIFS